MNLTVSYLFVFLLHPESSSG